MNISLLAIFIILTPHFIADFVCQTHWQAINKSKDNNALTQHVSIYAMCYLVPMWVLFYREPFNFWGAVFLAFLFSWITFVSHWVTDFFTSRLNTKLWAKEACKPLEDRRPHNFFVAIGFDAVLHYIQLFSTFYLLKSI